MRLGGWWLELLLFVLEYAHLHECESELMERVVEFALVYSQSTFATREYAGERIDGERGVREVWRSL